ncbi:hypothetical protein GCM10023205_26700 [Yinghuangia aomiensis]|uniref:Uncharacterized protein n=1 Tax=Yinghuangia aomiensis TaxID=676205 RepID=A0ABP9H4W8_9ACTN
MHLQRVGRALPGAALPQVHGQGSDQFGAVLAVVRDDRADHAVDEGALRARGRRARARRVGISRGDPDPSGFDDWEQYCYIHDLSGSGLIESPRKALEMRSDEFEALRAAGGCFVLTNHPFLSGRPARAAVLEELVRGAVGATDVRGTLPGRDRGARPRPRSRSSLDHPPGTARGRRLTVVTA